jgi:hypothetical protein
MKGQSKRKRRKKRRRKKVSAKHNKEVALRNTLGTSEDTK